MVCSHSEAVEDGMVPTCVMCGEASWAESGVVTENAKPEPVVVAVEPIMPLPKSVRGAKMLKGAE